MTMRISRPGLLCWNRTVTEPRRITLSESDMGRIFAVDLEGRTYRCKFCQTQLALAHEVFSRGKLSHVNQILLSNLYEYSGLGTLGFVSIPTDNNFIAFHCRRGKAYLFNSVVNITLGPPEQRMMLSGMHTIADIFCCCCGQIVGWKYVAAHEKSQKYKEGKFVLERGRIVDGAESEFYIDTHNRMSDGEDV